MALLKRDDDMVTADKNMPSGSVPPQPAFSPLIKQYQDMNSQELKETKMKLLREKILFTQRLAEVRKLLYEDLNHSEGLEALTDEEEYIQTTLSVVRSDLNYVIELHDALLEACSSKSRVSVSGRTSSEVVPRSTRSHEFGKQPSDRFLSKAVVKTAPTIHEEPDSDVDDLPDSPKTQSRYRCSLSKANSIMFDWLRCPLRLQSHFSTVERQLVEAKAGTFTKTEFHPDAELRMTLCTKLLKSLEKCSEVHMAAVDAAYASGHSWNHVKNVLMARFCRRSVLKAAYEKEFDSLRFEGHSKVDEYLRRTSRLYHLFVDVFKDDTSERRILVRRIVSVLPTDIASRVIEKIKSFGKSADEDWELILPFDYTHHEHDAVLKGTCVEEIIRSTCRCAEEVSHMKGSTSRSQNGKSDNVRLVGNKSQNDDLFDRLPKGTELRDWVESFEKVVTIHGQNLKSIKQLKEMAPKADEVKFCKSFKSGKAYGVLAFKQAEDYEGIPELCSKKQLKVYPFTLVKN
jgi:hypothetical protein